MNRGLINLATYSRPELLIRCLKSISSAEGSSNYSKLIVLQTGNMEVFNTVYEFVDSKTQVIEVNGKLRSPLQNINHNRWLSWQIGFENLDHDWILSVEEDVELHPSSLLFAEKIYEMYRTNPSFRGINLTSRLSDIDNLGTYSELRFGLHGCGAVITRDTWNKFSKYKIEKLLDSEPLDALIEPILKTGFMVTPNLSMLNDFGWFKGTHTSPNSNDIHYVEVSKSFEKNQIPINIEFIRKQVDPKWRSDCLLYRETDNFKFKFRVVILPLIRSQAYKRFYSKLRSIYRSFKFFKKVAS